MTPDRHKLTGPMTALVTPMDRDGCIDETRFRELCIWQIDQGISALVPAGTTGESPTLSHEEHQRIVSICLEVARERGVPVIAGTGSNSTDEALMLSQHAARQGADALLVVTPYYNKPSQEGLFEHYAALARAVEIPLIIYNIPGRSVVDMSIATMARLARTFPNIAGVKDATCDLARPLRIRGELGDDFIQLSGEDITLAAFLAQGGDGIISVSANIVPDLHAGLHRAWRQGNLAEFATLRDRLGPFHDACFIEPSPAPVKYALSLLGRCEPHVRLPLVPLSDAGRPRIRSVLEDAGRLCAA